MKFFISHSSQNKPTIKAIFAKMPLSIKTWIDEEQLVWGADLKPTFETAIKEQSDFVILFVSESSAKSEWVKNEIRWALSKEKALHRTILLPILIESGEEDCRTAFPEFSNRKMLILNNFDELGIARFAQEFSNYLFSFICNELSEAYSPSKNNVVRTLSNAQDAIEAYSKAIREIVFYHRENNKISVDELFQELTGKFNFNEVIDREQFDYILNQIVENNYLPGVYFDGYEMYLEEEHMAWKKEMFNDRKKAVAKKAAQMVKNGMTVYLDAGSTVGEIVSIICSRIKSNNLHTVRFVTNSISHANNIAECCVEKGWDESNSGILMDLIGGSLRPNTEATIPLKEGVPSFAQYEKFDLAFLGVNGATSEGFTVLNNKEYPRKKEAFAIAEKRVLLCDSSKCGISLPALLGNPETEFSVIMDDASTTEAYNEVIKTFGERIISAHCETGRK